MEIKSYKQASDIPDSILSSLVDSEIECWGLEPFSEYKICSDCKAVFSIEEVHWSLEDFRNKTKSWDDFECLECNWKTHYIYEPSYFLEEAREYVKWDVSSILLLTPDQKVEGFWILSKTNMSWLMEREFATRPSSYKKEDLLESLLDNFSWVDDLLNQDFICLHQIYISPYFRRVFKVFDMLKHMFSLRKEDSDLPIIMETRYDSKFFPITKKMWFDDIIDDKYWYVIQYLSKYMNLVNFLIANQKLTKRKFYI